MKKQSFTTHILGYPRIGANRELKWALESYWKGKTSEADLLETASQLRKQHWKTQADSGLDYVSVGDFSFYDQVLDTACTFGIIPSRFNWESDSIDLELYFALARGSDHHSALAMTKWFDTNYHYLVPEVEGAQKFGLFSDKLLREYQEASSLGYKAKPVIVAPATLLHLARPASSGELPPIKRIDELLPHYANLINQLTQAGAEWIQLDEPILGKDLSREEIEAVQNSYTYFANHCPEAKILVASYFGSLGENATILRQLPVAGVHLDLSESSAALDLILPRYSDKKVLSLGLLDGRNIWAANLAKKRDLIEQAIETVDHDRLWISSSCSLQHVPYRSARENLDKPLADYVAFAEEKLVELNLLSNYRIDDSADFAIRRSVQDHYTRLTSKHGNIAAVREQCDELDRPENRSRSEFGVRQKLQKAALDLPLLPTTTIGSFPQTVEIRKIRKDYKAGEITLDQYRVELGKHTIQCIRAQEEIGLDVLVHGEFERNDMVEFFADKLNGYDFTAYGWVQSYGSRCVKPPIIWADVSRRSSLSEHWIGMAQALTNKPVKGMLSGPITMLQWSFVRDDIPRELVALQIAVALREEIIDLEKQGIQIIQVDEPALREGLPLRKAEQKNYLTWAVNAFKLATAGVKDRTQIHTHMCYGNFEDIFQAIIDLDADVISIEATRNRLAILNNFVEKHYPNEIGLGIWDIHSPRIPSTEEMHELLAKAIDVVDPERVWVNPDCGLKTRGWAETEASLRNLVAAATQHREILKRKLATVV